MIFIVNFYITHNQLFCFELGCNAQKILTKKEITILTNSSYDCCLDLFQHRDSQFLIYQKEKFPVKFE